MRARLTWESPSRWVRPTGHRKPWIKPWRSSQLAISESGESGNFPWSKLLKRIDYWRTVISTKSSFSTPTEPAKAARRRSVRALRCEPSMPWPKRATPYRTDRRRTAWWLLLSWARTGAQLDDVLESVRAELHIHPVSTVAEVLS